MRLGITLDQLRVDALNRVENNAERSRTQHITTGAGQAMVYGAKLREAQAIIEAPAEAEIYAPYLKNEAENDGVSLVQKAAEVLNRARACDDLFVEIESVRRRNKQAILDAETATEIRLVLSYMDEH